VAGTRDVDMHWWCFLYYLVDWPDMVYATDHHLSSLKFPDGLHNRLFLVYLNKSKYTVVKSSAGEDSFVLRLTQVS
jgi:hypothetical protein